MRAISLALALILLVPSASSPVTAQQSAWTGGFEESIREAAWCLYMNARPYYLNAPDDLACEYEPRAMTLAEAQAHYQRQVWPYNLALAEWGCAEARANDGLSWKQDRKWAKRLERVARSWGRNLSAVEWPPRVKKAVTRLVDRDSAQLHYMRFAYNKKSYEQSFLSGAWNRWMTANNKASEAASQVRLTLRLSPVPTGPDDCKQAKRLQRLIEP